MGMITAAVLLSWDPLFIHYILFHGDTLKVHNQLPQSHMNNCTVPIYNVHTKPLRVPFKIFIYDLPSDFNTDLANCVMSACHDVSNCGYGKEVDESFKKISIRNTWSHALEVLIHMKLLASPYKTLDPQEADVFYLPFYVTLQAFCNEANHFNMSFAKDHSALSKRAREIIRKSEYHKEGKLHVMTLAMPYRKMIIFL